MLHICCRNSELNSRPGYSHKQGCHQCGKVHLGDLIEYHLFGAEIPRVHFQMVVC